MFKHQPLILINWHSKGDLIGNHIPHSLKGMVESDGHKLILVIKMVFLEPMTFATLQYSCKPQSCAATTGGHMKLTFFMYSPYLPVEAALSIFKVSRFAKICLIGNEF